MLPVLSYPPAVARRWPEVLHGWVTRYFMLPPGQTRQPSLISCSPTGPVPSRQPSADFEPVPHQRCLQLRWAGTRKELGVRRDKGRGEAVGGEALGPEDPAVGGTAVGNPEEEQVGVDSGVHDGVGGRE